MSFNGKDIELSLTLKNPLTFQDLPMEKKKEKKSIGANYHNRAFIYVPVHRDIYCEFSNRNFLFKKCKK